MQLKKVISCSRTKDVLRHSPEQLARILKGEVDCKLRFAGENARISLEDIHTIVLWTKTPFNLLHNKKLNLVLR